MTTKSWNPVLNIVAEIKKEYTKVYNDARNYGLIQMEMTEEDTEKLFQFSRKLEDWISVLNNEDYNKFFAPLQINQHKNFVLIRYATLFEIPEMWEDPNSPYRECRSVVIDLEKMELVSTPFRKFFGVNQVPETMEDVVAEKIAKAESIEISDKLDGSMQHATWYNNRIYLFGSQSLDPNNSWRLAAGYNLLTAQHQDMIKSYPNFTFIFEMISPNNPHVVQYQQEDEGLYLIGIRNKTNGVQLMYQTVKMIASNNVPMVKIEDKTFQEIMEEAKTIQAHEKEGWVINVDGEFIKVKGDDYTFMHRTLDKIAAPNVIIQAIADGNYDDVISKVPVAYRKNAGYLYRLIGSYVHTTNSRIKMYYDKAPKEDKRSFMIYVNDNVPQDFKGYVRAKYNGEEINYLKSRNGSYKRLKDLGATEEAYNKFKRGEQ